MRLAALAPLLFVLLWSTGFIGAKLGLPYAEPFSFLWVRMVLVVGLLLLLAWWLRFELAPGGVGPLATRRLLGRGVLCHLEVDARGSFAPIVGLQPILTAILAQYLLRERVNRGQWAGLLLGFGGVALVVLDPKRQGLAGGGTLEASAFVAIGLALLCTTLGTLYQQRFAAEMPLVGGTVVQYVAAAGALWLLAWLFGGRLGCGLC